MTPKPTLSGSEPGRPLDTVYFHVTARCNLSCVYCYSDSGPETAGTSRDAQDELGHSEACHVMSGLSAMPLRKLVLTGGEPLLREDVFDLAGTFKASHTSAKLCVNTNGAGVTPECVPDLVRLFDDIRVSVDGFRPVNDLLRGCGSFDAALRAIGLIRESGGEPSVTITLTRRNRAGLGGFIHYMSVEWGITRIRVNPIRRLGRARSRPDLLLEGSSGVSAGASGSPISTEEDCPDPPCNGSWSCVGTTMSITPQGLAFPCHWLSGQGFYLGNVRTDSLERLYGRLQDLRRPMLEGDDVQ